MPLRIAVVGLGYVGLPVAISVAEAFPGTIGFDINPDRVNSLKLGEDRTGEADLARLRKTTALLTANAEDMRAANVFIVCVPAPVYDDHRPDLTPLEKASEIVGRVMSPGAVVAYESTVYPGLTEEFCGPVLARASGLKQGVDFKLGYSPGRINPGNKQHTFETIRKVVIGEDEETTAVLAEIYGCTVKAGIHIASSIRVAETAKVIENTQRDINIAPMNEVTTICDLMRIHTKDVLDAAGTKWNFLNFTPGLVGGHCIGVDPYYLPRARAGTGLSPGSHSRRSSSKRFYGPTYRPPYGALPQCRRGLAAPGPRRPTRSDL